MKNDTLVKQNTAAPTRKQTANLLGSQSATILLVLFAVFLPEFYARIPSGMEAGLGSAIGGILGFALGYLVKERV